MGDRVADQDDAVGHARSLSNSVKKLGYETAALSARSIDVEPVAMRPAMANVIARRWSSRVWVGDPTSCEGPSMVMSSPSTVIRAPSAASPPAIPAMRSDSLLRNSPAPRIVVLPRAWVAARQRIGISSIAAATSPCLLYTSDAADE